MILMPECYEKLDLICFLLLIVGAVSCSNVTTDNLDEDLIIGTWKPITDAVFADDGTPEVFEKTPCEQTSRFTLATDGDFTYTALLN